MRSFTSAALLIALNVPATPAQAREVRRLQPTSKWVVNYAEETCRLGREFGAGDQKVTVIFEQFVPGDAFTLTLVGDMARPVTEIRPIAATVRFGPQEEELEASGTPATISGTRAFILDGQFRVAPPDKAEKAAMKAAESRRDTGFELPPLDPARERAAAWLEIGRAFKFDLVLETGPMDKPLAALRACSWDTIRSWGLPVDQQRSLTRKARPVSVPWTWFRGEDYPRDMLVGDFEGHVHFRVIVDAAGKPESCHVQSSTRPQGFSDPAKARAFDEAVCGRLMKRAKFHPALDAQGRPVRSYWRQSVYFRIR